MNYFLAAFPILLVLGLMIFFHWSGQRAGAAGWVAGLMVAGLFFGLNGSVLWVSQLKSLFLSLFVLAILWPALLLYKVVDQTGGIQAIAHGLERWIGDGGLLLILLAWAFSGLLEGLAGFGLPIAIVAPMLIGLGVPAVQAVAAVAIGHAWAVTFGDMSVVFQTLAAVVGRPQEELAPLAGLFLGVACVLCGLGSAAVLKQKRHFPIVIGVGALMAVVQYGLAVTPLVPLAVLGAGLAGIVGIAAWAKIYNHKNHSSQGTTEAQPVEKHALLAGLGSYGLLAVLLCVVFLVPSIYNPFKQTVWQMQFPKVVTRTGIITLAGAGQAFRPLVHPGFYLLLTALIGVLVMGHFKLLSRDQISEAMHGTYKSAAPVSIGILSMVGLSSLMEHCGMTLLLAQGLSSGLGSLFPLISPLVGVLGAFATGSNNNSNVLFAPLQNSAAMLLSIDPRILLATQTTGGALGSMVAPAKIIVGCSTAGILGEDGKVLRTTIPYCLGICLLLGLLAWILAW
ncbi:MAG: L-lactate permease [Chloroflexi bacterium]|nr:L-lactate permease [Chloroflexota bacterium]